jgi:hypothetical protein
VINNHIDKNQLELPDHEEDVVVDKKPDEKPSLVVQGFFKIYDPESGEVMVQGRA